MARDTPCGLASFSIAKFSCFPTLRLCPPDFSGSTISRAARAPVPRPNFVNLLKGHFPTSRLFLVPCKKILTRFAKRHARPRRNPPDLAFLRTSNALLSSRTARLLPNTVFVEFSYRSSLPVFWECRSRSPPILALSLPPVALCSGR